MDEEVGVLSLLPEEMHYLIEPALRYGVHQFDSQVVAFLDNATEEDLRILSEVRETIREKGHGDRIDDFLDQYGITDYQESAKLYFLLGLLDATAGPDTHKTDWNNVDQHIADLQRHGSYRLASERMWAARLLSEFGAEAERALPYLRQALNDEDGRVRVWAHYTLAVLEGDKRRHNQAIRNILSTHKSGASMEVRDVRSECEAALERMRWSTLLAIFRPFQRGGGGKGSTWKSPFRPK